MKELTIESTVHALLSLGIGGPHTSSIPAIQVIDGNDHQHLPGCGHWRAPRFNCPECGARAVMTRDEVFARMESEELIATRYRRRVEAIL